MKKKLKYPIKEEINLTPKEYSYLFFKSLVFPKQYSILVSKYNKLQNGLFFFLINLLLTLLFYTFLKNISSSINLLFSFVSEIIFFIPFSLLLLILFTFILHTFSKIAGGKGSIKNSFNAICYSTSPLIFLPVKYLKLVGILYFIVLLIYNYKNFQNLSLVKAGFIIILPSLMIILFLIMTGIITLL